MIDFDKDDFRINCIKHFDLPRKEVVRNISIPDGEPEMSEFESGFLCGLIRQFMPRKIVEVGVAAGGTTAIILQCLEMLGLDYNMYSIDSQEYFYRNKSEKTGFIVDQCKKNLAISDKHFLLLGDVACSYMEKIGKDVDFLVLDTTHLFPGEIIEFLSLLPYVKKEGCVVLHDISLNLQSNNVNGMATGAVFAAACGKKYINYDNELCKGYSNIGAIIVNDDTLKYVFNIFLCLFCSWKYIPSENELDSYRECIQKNYPKDMVELFDKAIILNKRKIGFYQRIKEAGKILLRGR